MSFNISKTIDVLSDTTVRYIRNCKRLDKINRKTVCTFGIAHKYFDFRDTLIRYYVYLPFADTVELENAKILGRTLTIDVYVDVRTGALKYYIMADGCLIKTVGGQVRLDMPISSTNPMQKYQQIRNDSASLLNEGMSLVGKGVSSANSISSGNPVTTANGALGIISDTLSTAQTYADLKTPMGYNFNGNYSPSTCVDDPLDIYLYTVESNIDYDQGLKNNYGIPSNKWAVIGNNNGYVKADDVKLTGNIPQDDKADILATLQSGIYVV